MVLAFIRIVLIVSFFLVPVCFSAETVKFKHILSVYTDDKGTGMKQPEGLSCNEKSLLLVADTGNGRLLQYSFQDKSIKDGKEIKIPQVSYPLRVQTNSKGEIFVLDGKQRRIARLSPEGEFKGYLDTEGLPSPSTFIPKSFKIDNNDQVCILDIFSGRVLVLSPEGKYLKHIDLPKDYGFFTDLAVDSRGTIFLLDSKKASVLSAPKDGNNFSPLGESLKEDLSFPVSLTTDLRGTLYVVDGNGAGIVILGKDGSFLGRLLSMGWNEGLLYYPTQMCMNEKGEVFIADRGNNRVQIFSLVK